MKVEGLHGFDLSPAEARRLQEELAPRIVQGPPLDLGEVRYVAGADVSTQGDRAYATVAVLDFPGLSVVEVKGYEAALGFPYVPGLLSLSGDTVGRRGSGEGRDGGRRRDPRRPGRRPSAQDGARLPRRASSSTFRRSGVPRAGSSGSTRSRRPEKGERDRSHGPRRGDRTRAANAEGVSPVYVSVGNRVDLGGAVELVLACCTRYRLPETTRQAHNAANRLRKGEPPEGSLF